MEGYIFRISGKSYLSNSDSVIIVRLHFISNEMENNMGVKRVWGSPDGKSPLTPLTLVKPEELPMLCRLIRIVIESLEGERGRGGGGTSCSESVCACDVYIYLMTVTTIQQKIKEIFEKKISQHKTYLKKYILSHTTIKYCIDGIVNATTPNAIHLCIARKLGYCRQLPSSWPV